MRRPRALMTAAAASLTLAAVAVGGFPVTAAAAEPTEDRSGQTVAPEIEPRLIEEPDPDHDCGETGEYQEEVEQILDTLGDYGTVFVDGEQSVQDCAAIKKFQKRMGIEPDAGYAGPVTKGIGDRLVETALEDCDAASKGKTVCVDLTHQTLWVVDSDGERLTDPTVTRTGMKGYATTPGTHEINVREEKHWSNPYDVWLPYWQHFHDGEGLHETTTYLHDESIGSHGCVNLLPSDAEELYGLLDYNDTVEVFGKRPGT